MKLAVYTDYAYSRVDGEVYAERAFAIFLGRLRSAFESLVLVGRLRPDGGQARYPVPAGVELAGLPYYEKLSEPGRALGALARSVSTFWQVAGQVDCVWLLGPHPLAIVFVVLAAARRRRIVLGVRQNLPVYVRSRHPGRRSLHVAASLLELIFRLLARRLPVVVVGPELAHNYRHSEQLLEIVVSLISEDEIVAPEAALARPYDGELMALVVSRLEREKNPLLLADVLAAANREAQRWRLVVCGEGDLSEALIRKLAESGQGARSQVLGYVAFGPDLLELYRRSHVLLHLSSTEGLPQVLLEAFAAGLPVVASDVGGIRGAVGPAAVLVGPDDVAGAAAALNRLATDFELRERMIRAGIEYVADRTIAAESGRLTAFLAGQAPGRSGHRAG